MRKGIGSQAACGAVLAVALAAGPGVRAEGGHEHHHEHQGGAPAGAKSAAQPAAAVTLTGEVLDLSCYMGHGAKGAEHQSCANKCLLEGSAPGLLTDDGAVYLLVKDHNQEKAFESVPGLAAARVTVTGKKTVKGGLQALLVEKIRKI